MERGSKFLRLWMAGLLLSFVTVSASFASTPMEQVKETVNQVLAILQEPAIKADARKAERRELLRNAIIPRFDFSEMARRSLGRHWKDQNGRQEEFVSVFANFVESAYISKLESFKDEKIIFVRERIEREHAEVETKVIPSKGEQFSINYRLHLVKGEWKVHDVVVENISLVNNYRSQFNRILANASFDDLVRKLREKGGEKGI